MKKLFLILTILYHLSGACQEVDMNSSIKSNFEFAERMLSESKIQLAVESYFSLCNLNNKTEIGKISCLKMNSLKARAQKELIDKWKGTWKLRKSSNGDYIVFTDTEIKFYSDEKLLKSEKIVFNEIDTEDIVLTCWQLVFSNNEIWDFVFPTFSGGNIMYAILKRNEVGEYLIKHSNIYKDGRKTDPYKGEKCYEKIE